MTRREMYARFVVAILKLNSGAQAGRIVACANDLVDGYSPSSAKRRDPKTGRFASETAQQAAEDEAIRAMAQALPDSVWDALQPTEHAHRLPMFKSENGWSP